MNPNNIPETKAKDLLVSNKPMSLRELIARNVSGGTRFVMIFNSASAVADGVAPTYSFKLEDKEVGIFSKDPAARFPNGIYVCSSTTDDTKTLSASDDIKWSADITTTE